MFIHRQTLSKRIRVVLLFYIPLPLSLGIGNIKNNNTNFKGWNQVGAAVYRNPYVQVGQTDIL